VARAWRADRAWRRSSGAARERLGRGGAPTARAWRQRGVAAEGRRGSSSGVAARERSCLGAAGEGRSGVAAAGRSGGGGKSLGRWRRSRRQRGCGEKTECAENHSEKGAAQFHPSSAPRCHAACHISFATS
jgi:hypothetical protein